MKGGEPSKLHEAHTLLEMQGEEEDDDDEVIGVQERDVNGHTLRLIKCPEAVSSRLKWWVFVRQIDYILFQTAQNSSNTLHDLESMELTSTIRHYRRAGDHGATQAEAKAIMKQFALFVTFS